MSTLMDMIDDLLREEHVNSLPEWTGIPLGGLVTDYHHPAELDEGWRRWVEVHGHFNSIFLSKMWHRSYSVPHADFGAHSIDQYDVDLRCAAGAHDEHRATLGLGRICHCVGDTLTQLLCAPCSWHHVGGGRAGVLAWHDHAFPGWRSLPTVPANLRATMGGTTMTPKLEEWFDANYPAAFRVPGAPIIRPRAPRQPRRPRLQPLRRVGHRPLNPPGAAVNHQPTLLGLELEPTIAMRDGRQRVWQCANCGLVAVQTTLAPGPLAGCPACSSDTWRQQQLPLAGLQTPVTVTA